MMKHVVRIHDKLGDILLDDRTLSYLFDYFYRG